MKNPNLVRLRLSSRVLCRNAPVRDSHLRASRFDDIGILKITIIVSWINYIN